MKATKRRTPISVAGKNQGNHILLANNASELIWKLRSDEKLLSGKKTPAIRKNQRIQALKKSHAGFMLNEHSPRLTIGIMTQPVKKALMERQAHTISQNNRVFIDVPPQQEHSVIAWI
ncbi:hypothetical protein JXA32_03760 [Candidatus Sumerlaeota bacterium]|nr:hypothetical protein [Candidatus Sumerlaeota bacterium]